MYCYFYWENFYFISKLWNFDELIDFTPIQNNRNIVKINSWKTCFEALKILKIQELPGTLPWTIDPSLQIMSVTPPNFNSWTRPFQHPPSLFISTYTLADLQGSPHPIFFLDISFKMKSLKVLK
jgi:hypothetical protein